MTVKINDLPEGHEETSAMRLRKSRDDKGLTRPELSKKTGIPTKTIEKFEIGSQEPTLSRLKTLSEVLGVSAQWIMCVEGSEAPTDRAPATTDEILQVEAGNDESPIVKVRGLLSVLNAMRQKGFTDVGRRALALIEDTKVLMASLEPEELVDLAEENGLDKCEGENKQAVLDYILNLFQANTDDGQRYCGNIEARIIDTAVLGLDLWVLSQDHFLKLAKILDVKLEHFEVMWFEDDMLDPEKTIPMLRLKARESAIKNGEFVAVLDEVGVWKN